MEQDSEIAQNNNQPEAERRIRVFSLVTPKYLANKKLFATIPRSPKSSIPISLDLEATKLHLPVLNPSLHTVKSLTSIPSQKLSKKMDIPKKNPFLESNQDPVEYGRMSYIASTQSSSDFSQQQSAKNIHLYKDKIKSKQTKRNQIRIKHKVKYSSKIEEKRRRYSEKMFRFEVRTNKVNIKPAGEAWYVMIVSVMWCKSIRKKFDYKRELRKRSDKILIRFTVITRAIGKFLRHRKNSRVRNSLKLVRSLVIPSKRQCSPKKFKNTYTIVSAIDILVTKSLLFKIMATWQQKLVFIQRSLRNALAHCKMRNGFHRLLWNRVEIKMTKEFLAKRNSNNKDGIRELVISGKTNTPNEVKDFYLKRLLKQKVLSNIQKLKDYNTQLAIAKAEFEKARRSKPTGPNSQEDSKEILFEPPQRPHFGYLPTQTELRAMILQAFHSKNIWHTLVNRYLSS